MFSTLLEKLLDRTGRRAPLGTTVRRKPATRRENFRPCLDPLEDRTLMSGTGVTPDAAASTYLQTPLSFEANQGQTDASVRYLARGSGYALFLTPDQAVLSLTNGS